MNETFLKVPLLDYLGLPVHASSLRDLKIRGRDKLRRLPEVNLHTKKYRIAVQGIFSVNRLVVCLRFL